MCGWTETILLQNGLGQEEELKLPRKDAYHDLVRNLLERDGWIITHDPLRLIFAKRDVYIDLGAEAPIGAEKDGCKIAVEVKSFVGKSEVLDFENALGQYVLYKALLETQQPDRVLYLAVPDDVYLGILSELIAEEVLRRVAVRMVVFSPEGKLQWIEPPI